MGALDRFKKLRRRKGEVADGDADPPGPPPGQEGAQDAADVPESTQLGTLRSLTGWVEQRAHSVVSKIYETRADEIEERARRVVGSAYRDQADDLEERAVRALRRAIALEADRIKETIEHGVAVKKREVRLSLVVLITASLVYLVLYWLTRQPPAS